MENWYFLILIPIAVLVAAWLVTSLVRLSSFGRERRYLLIELGRCRPSERKYWRRRIRRLWLSLFFPFIRY